MTTASPMRQDPLSDPDFPLLVRAGCRARRSIIEAGGLKPGMIAGMLGASGGPKWLVLRWIDEVVARRLLLLNKRPVTLIGSSIGSWRLACHAHPDPLEAFARFADSYLSYRYEAGDDRRKVTVDSRSILDPVFTAEERAAMFAGSRRLAIVTARGRGPLGRVGGPMLAAGLLALAAANALSRRHIRHFVERVVFADPRVETLQFPGPFTTRRAPLAPDVLADALMASGAIPFVLEPVRDPPGAPAGTYWDGGLVDYHFAPPPHLELDETTGPGILLYPHFRGDLVPGWFDKPWVSRHSHPAHFDDLLLFAPSPSFVARLPHGKIPDRGDFKLLPDNDERLAYWRLVLDEARRLGDALEFLLEGDALARRLESLPG
ncbi:MAG: patatin-like phospholipase family protein [Alphaproteobacteria bacterium]|nr:MAG: patatin-like phospholipase family protein [Alphaproteobacteria bacterium]